MKKLMAMILTFAMVMSLCVVPASAAGSGVAITITPDNSSVDTATGDAVVTYTVKAKVTDPNLKVGAMTIILDPGTGLKLAEETKKKNPDFYYQANAAKYQYNEETNDTGIFETVFNYAPKTKTFVASGTTNDRNLNSTHGEIVLMTIMGKIAKGTTGSVTLGVSTANYGDPSGEASSIVNCDVPPATVTITKAPIDSVTASVEKPVAGQPLDTSVDIGTASGYTGAVEWYEGDSATGTAATGDAKANTKYTAKITLTASSGESFADSVTIPADYTKDSSSTNNKLVLTNTFPETGSLPAASVADAPTAKSGLTYTGSAQDLLGFKGNASGGTMQYSLDNSSWSDAIPTGKNAGNYTVYYMVKGDSSHSDSAVANIKVTIGQKDISGVTIGTIADQPYTGSAITPDPEVKDSTTKLEKGKDYTVSCTDKYVGTAELTITGKGNYTGTTTANFTIVAADQTPTFTTPKDLVKGGHKLDLTSLVDGAKGDMIFTIASGTAANLEMGNTLVSTGITGVVTINVTIKAKDVNGDSINEYNEFKQDNAITVNVVDKTTNTSTMKVSQDNIIYGETVSPSVTNKPDGTGTVSYTYEGREGTSYNSTTAPTNVGKYKVTATCESSTTIYTAEDTFAIQPKRISGVTVTLNKTTTVYDGNNQTVSVTVKDGASTLTKDTDYTVTGATSGTNVNSYTVTVNGKGNYAGSVEKTWEITQATPTYTAPTGLTAKYGQTLADITLPTSWSWMNSTQSVGDASTTAKTFKAKFTPTDNTNYKTVEDINVSVTVGKADARTLEEITVNQKYNVTTEQSKNIGTAGMPADAGTLTYTKGTATQTGSVAIDSWAVDATTGKVTYKLSNGAVGDTVTLPVIIKSTNYADSTVKVVITLIKGSSGGYYYAPTVPDMPMLYRGCTGDAVKTLQDKLNALGYNSGSVDGIFGAKTYAAVTAFQKANSLGVDGIVGKLTWGKLYGVSPAMPVETTTVVGRPTVSYGSRGDAVRKLQELLNALGYDCGSVDGIFGSKTKAAVLAFQKANGLGVDGIVGPLTWAKLG